MLGVPRDATTAEIRRAWLEKARRLHPDAGGDDEAAMRQVNEAWRVLGDPGRRLAHDRDLGIDHGPRWSAPPPPRADGDERAVPLDEQVDVPRSTRAGDLVVLVPPALLAAGVASLVVATMMVNTVLLGAAFALLVLSAVSFVVAPFLALARDRRRRR